MHALRQPPSSRPDVSCCLLWLRLHERGELMIAPIKAFFNIILRDLGVKNVKTQELFTLDQASLDALSKPVFGLIFLFQYEPGHEEDERPMHTESDIWFANQARSRLTLTLLNIVMNSENLDLGERLQDFKESTKDLCTALRGHSISSNKFIRKVHNSFTRRMDQLNADLCLENDVSDSKKKSSSRKAGKRKRKSKKTALEEYGYHFIAYVPHGTYVWELDGLRRNPLKLGPLESQDWTTIARPQIEARMLQNEDSQLSFNLLAVCRGPLLQHSRKLATMLAALGYIRSRMDDSEPFRKLISADEPVLDIDDQAQLAKFNLSYSDLQNAEIPHQLKVAASRSNWEVSDAYHFYQRFSLEARAAMDEFRSEIIVMEEDDHRVTGRRRDYGSALHCWVQKLAEKGVLEDIIKMSS
ncbi:ubiquitin carboxyl-terminal hydrolase [Metarhizium album ARSEF 1941]|uniref:ubiquitinyl hydrolase 1 n=1 Tax=Metarhizium album (strain ARSEF 1941) TaxID=1081103 RepID=A0A0B2X6Y9_METAS|nr:ubiquitin carboxyl-terminal hydrolase [Metarhizium album ARSEF 1941]KHO01071.1 ubiquitin carboxyl-terminal hydrolase [Metarhizium album ARSEF 1941]